MWRVLRGQSDFRLTTLRNQLTSLILFESLTTGRLNGKMLTAFADRFFNRTKKGDLAAQKLAHQTLLDKNAVKKLFEEIHPRFDQKATNYVRLVRANSRLGDNAPQVMVALLKAAEAKASPSVKSSSVKTKATK